MLLLFMFLELFLERLSYLLFYCDLVFLMLSAFGNQYLRNKKEY